MAVHYNLFVGEQISILLMIAHFPVFIKKSSLFLLFMYSKPSYTLTEKQSPEIHIELSHFIS